MNEPVERKGYQWPASALTCNEMEILTEWREELNIPITELLRQAVVECDRIINREEVKKETI